MVRELILYSGLVQGVGFRWAAMRIAASYHVTGFVRNLDDGRVEMVVEGEPSEVDAFRAAVESRMGGYIQGVERQELETRGEFSGFRIAH